MFMDEEIFRKKTVEKLTAPEDLHKFIKIANPGIWVLIIAVISFLIGVLVWGFVGRLEVTVASCTLINPGIRDVITYVSIKDGEKIARNQIIRAYGKEIKIDSIMSQRQMELDEVIEAPVLRRTIAMQLGWNDNEIVFGVASIYPDPSEVEVGFIPSVVVTRVVSPLTYVFN